MRGSARKLNRGVTLIEVMIASLAVFVVVVGAMNFQFHCATHIRQADTRATAGRLGLLLLEDWKTTGGPADYNPVLVFGSGPTGLDILDIEASDTGPGGLANEILAGPCKVTFESTEYCVTLSYADGISGPAGPRMLNASVARLSRSGQLDRPVSLTTYVYY